MVSELDFGLKLSSDILARLLLDQSRCILGRGHRIVWGIGEGLRREISLTEVKEILSTTDGDTEMVTPREVVAKMNNEADVAAGYKRIDIENWQTYVSEPKIEITCGEAPFIVDINCDDLTKRSGFLDRKLHYVNKYCQDEPNWQKWARLAYQAAYGYEIRGNRLLRARINLLRTYQDFYRAKFPGREVERNCLKEVAEIISWNLFQMDGRTEMVPGRRLRAKIKDWSNSQVIDFWRIRG